MSLGNFHPQKTDDFFWCVAGEIITLDRILACRIKRKEFAPEEDRFPTHHVFVKGSHGREVEVGAAWERKMSRGEKAGESFLSVSLSLPGEDFELSFAIFKEDDQKARAVHRTRQAKKPTPQESQDRAPVSPGPANT